MEPVVREKRTFQIQICKRTLQIWIAKCQFTLLFKQLSNAPIIDSKLGLHDKKREKPPVVRKIDTFSNPNLHVQETGKHNIQIIETVSFFSNHTHLADSRSLKWTPVLREKQTFQIQICKHTLQIWITKCPFSWIIKLFSHAQITRFHIGFA